MHLPTIPASKRRTLGSFHREFAKAKPFILAALLDAVSCALGQIDSVSLSEAPRMADFAKCVVASENALGWPQGAFLDSYAANRAKSDQAAIEANPVALAILSLMEGRQHWSGTATELKLTLRDRFPNLTENRQSSPRSEARFGSALRRQRLTIDFSREGKAEMRVIELTNG